MSKAKKIVILVSLLTALACLVIVPSGKTYAGWKETAGLKLPGDIWYCMCPAIEWTPTCSCKTWEPEPIQ
jgi:hypothetical protein